MYQRSWDQEVSGLVPICKRSLSAHHSLTSTIDVTSIDIDRIRVIWVHIVSSDQENGDLTVYIHTRTCAFTHTHTHTHISTWGQRVHYASSNSCDQRYTNTNVITNGDLSSSQLDNTALTVTHALTSTHTHTRAKPQTHQPTPSLRTGPGYCAEWPLSARRWKLKQPSYVGRPEGRTRPSVAKTSVVLLTNMLRQYVI